VLVVLLRVAPSGIRIADGLRDEEGSFKGWLEGRRSVDGDCEELDAEDGIPKIVRLALLFCGVSGTGVMGDGWSGLGGTRRSAPLSGVSDHGDIWVLLRERLPPRSGRKDNSVEVADPALPL